MFLSFSLKINRPIFQRNNMKSGGSWAMLTRRQGFLKRGPQTSSVGSASTHQGLF